MGDNLCSSSKISETAPGKWLGSSVFMYTYSNAEALFDVIIQ